jgi:hypothetical protein
MGASAMSRWFGEKWQDWVGGFDADTQRYIAQRTLALTGRSGIPDWMAQGIFISVGMLILTMFFAWMIRQRKQKTIPTDPLEDEWQNACGKLRKFAPLPLAATPKQAAQTANFYLEQASARSFGQLAQRYIQQQYFPIKAKPEMREQLTGALKQWRGVGRESR